MIPQFGRTDFEQETRSVSLWVWNLKFFSPPCPSHVRLSEPVTLHQRRQPPFTASKLLFLLPYGASWPGFLSWTIPLNICLASTLVFFQSYCSIPSHRLSGRLSPHIQLEERCARLMHHKGPCSQTWKTPFWTATSCLEVICPGPQSPVVLGVMLLKNQALLLFNLIQKAQREQRVWGPLRMTKRKQARGSRHLLMGSCFWKFNYSNDSSEQSDPPQPASSPCQPGDALSHCSSDKTEFWLRCDTPPPPSLLPPSLTPALQSHRWAWWVT